VKRKVESWESRDVCNKSIPQLSKGYPSHPCVDEVREIHKDIQRKGKKSYRGPIHEYYYYYYYYSKAAMSCLDKVPQIHKDNQGEKNKYRGPIHEYYYYYSKQL
jgi:hypothetical protein